jgi:CubicO group peptidase (beta-lactamase class C family)
MWPNRYRIVWTAAGTSQYDESISPGITLPAGDQRVRLELLVLCLAISACAHAPTKPGAAEPRPPVLREVVAEQQKDLSAKVAENSWPDLAVGVVLDGQLVYSAGFGASDPETKQRVTDRTLFRLASITKVFTGMALLQLQESGKLDLDDPVSELLPELNGVIYPTSEHPPIRIRHLVTHTSGLPRDGKRSPGMSQQELLQSLQGMALEFTPGYESQYSNLGMALAGVIISRASGLPYREYMQRFILGPLGMTDSVWDPAAATQPVARGMTWDETAKTNRPIEKDLVEGAMEPCGGLYSNVTDMAKFMAFQMKAWPPRSAAESAILSRSAVRESQVPAGLVIPEQNSGHAPVGSIVGNGGRGDIAPGVNWWSSEWRDLGLSVWHNGWLEGYQSDLLIFPKRGLGVIVLSGELKEHATNRVLEQLVAAFAPLSSVPEPVLGDDLRRALDRLIAWIDSPSLGGAATVFTPSMLGMKSLVSVTTEATESRGNHCRLDQVLHATRHSAKVKLACARGTWTFEARMKPTTPYLISAWWWP